MAGLLLVLLDRLQTHELLLAADPATGATRTLLSEADPAWINLHPQSGGAQRGGYWICPGSCRMAAAFCGPRRTRRAGGWSCTGRMARWTAC